MYETFYGLREKPFNLTPDPRFLYLSHKHKEAFAHLLYGIHNRCGFVLISGEIGTGKTTICRSLLNQLDDDTEVAFIFNPKLSPQELLRKINEDFGIRSRADTVKGLIDELNQYLLDRASERKNCVIVIDEAQNLNTDVLEQVRLLSNLETERQKLLQIVLIGQPELRDMLGLPELRQLNQRITARYHLESLNLEETLQYIAFRLRVAGGKKRVRFAPRAIRAIYKISRGTPRVINAICDRALLIGYTRETKLITPEIVKAAAKEVHGPEHRTADQPRLRQVLTTSAVVMTLAALLLAVILLSPGRRPSLNAMADSAKQGWSSVVEASGSASPVAEDHTLADSSGAGAFRTAAWREAPLVATVNLPEPPAPVDSAKVEVPNNEDASAPPVETKAPPKAPPVKVTKPEPEQELSLAERIVRADGRECLNNALTSLLQAWQVSAIGDTPTNPTVTQIAQFARQHGFAATELTTELEGLLAVNLPALVQVEQGGITRWAALVAAEETSLELAAASSEPDRVSRPEFAEMFSGRAVILWIDPSPNAAPLRAISSGEQVWELQTELRQLGLTDREPTGSYDAGTIDAVTRIQRAAGLVVDGITGPQTRMVLTCWSGEFDTPTLHDRPFPETIRQRVRASQGMIADASDATKTTTPPDAPVRIDPPTLQLFPATVESGTMPPTNRESTGTSGADTAAVPSESPPNAAETAGAGGDAVQARLDRHGQTDVFAAPGELPFDLRGSVDDVIEKEATAPSATMNPLIPAPSDGGRDGLK